MDCRKWIERYSIDCRLKYSSLATQKNYISCVATFLYYFKNEREPKEIPTQSIKEWLLRFGINTRNHKLCAIKSFYELTVGMPVKIDKIPYAKKSKSLPIVLSVDEIQKMFSVCKNYQYLPAYKSQFNFQNPISIKSDKVMKEKKDHSIMIRFTKKKKWLKEVIDDEAKYLDESRNYIILEALTERFKDKEPPKKVRR